MSFRWFVYFSALCGGWSAFLGWALGRMLAGESMFADMTSRGLATYLEVGIKGLILGLLVSLALGVVDAIWNLPAGSYGQMAQRAGASLLVGCFGGLLGGLLGQGLFDLTNNGFFRVLGWTITGLLIGMSLGVFEMVTALQKRQPVTGPRAKLVKGLAGGAVGGLVGGSLSLVLGNAIMGLFQKPDQALDRTLYWSPTAIGFVALGLCIGLMVGLSQVLFREAWIRVQSGFRAGRELLLTRDETVIGRAEGSDIALFGDAGVERKHARIVRRGDRFVLEHLGGAGGTYVNDSPVTGPTALKSGDLIRVGRSVLSFGERQKRAATAV
jgi:hypothetical protein